MKIEKGESDMTGWRTFKGVTIAEVFKNASAYSNHYRLILARKNEDQNGFGNHYSEIDIQQFDLKEKLERLLKGETSREYFAYGMINIDVFSKGKEFVIDHSPFDGCHDEYVLKKGEMERLIQLLTISTQKEVSLKNMLEKMVQELNSARINHEVILPSDWNEELKKLGVQTFIQEDSKISVNDMV
jgi:hypothetical protein